MFPTISKPLISENRAIVNLEVIASLEPGKKITCNQETGVIIIDNREILVALRRSVDGSYDSDVVQETFRKVLEVIEGIGPENSMEGHRVKGDWDKDKLVGLFEEALKGLVTLDETYKSEGKDRNILKIEEKFHRGLLNSKKHKMQTEPAVQEKREKSETSAEESEEENGIYSASINESDSESDVDEEKKEMPFIPLLIPEGDPQDEEGVILAEPDKQERVIGPEDYEDFEGFEGPDIFDELGGVVSDLLWAFNWVTGGTGTEHTESAKHDE